MSWMLIAVTVWTVVAMALALLIGRSIRLADELETLPGQPAAPDFVPVDWTVPTAGPR
jgi:hypothetical protein